MDTINESQGSNKCMLCPHPCNLDDNTTYEGSFELVGCQHRYHRLCYRVMVDSEKVNRCICGRDIPKDECIALGLIAKEPEICDSNPPGQAPDSPTSGLTGLMGNVKLEPNQGKPTQNTASTHVEPPVIISDQTKTTTTTTSQEQASDQSQGHSTGVAPSQRGRGHIGPNRTAFPHSSEYNAEALLQGARRILESHDSALQLPALEQFTEKTNKLRCQTRLQKNPKKQCKAPAVFPIDEPVECKKHFNIRLLKEDTEAVNGAKAEVSLIESVHKARSKLLEKSQKINEAAPVLIQATVEDEKKLVSEIAKLDTTMTSVHEYIRRISPPSSRGGSQGTQTPNRQ